MSRQKNRKITAVETMEIQDTCAYRPKSGGMMSSIPCCGHLHDKLCFKLFVFLAVFLLDAVDLVSDWLLYVDVAGAEEGLVYGPPEDILRYSLLAFSIIGSFTFTFEIVNLWWDVFRNDPWLDADLLSAITVWIEDVPQITINVVIVACREEAISYFQLVKASVIIIGAVIRIIVSLIRYCNKKARHDLQCAKVNPESRRHVVYRVFIMIGLIITLGGAITIFMFTQSERNPDGSLNFKVPHSVIEGEYDDQKYFHNVSIYFSHKLFDWDTTSKVSPENLNLVRLFRINDIRREKVDRTIKVQYDQQTGPTKIIIWERDIHGTMKAKECFQMDKTNQKLTIGPNCASFISPKVNQYVLKFRYIKPSIPRLIFGDIKYNIKVQVSPATCKTPEFAINNDIKDHSDNRKVAALHYYRTKGDSTETNHIVHKSATEGTFYHSADLEDIIDVWKTGFAYCKSSGSLAPHLDNFIDVSCS
ncbi:uncharacterized protein LOC128547303 [Mercenaria mercenaria]|uniref:uncharacterized protein LOC128547303 n=1 Tax=Mercenaria mercenaria TaxID=6596 RepID=UPI00234F2A12|nr:uncharacterized protein LOC128547303 [Mercenaria mercenaria]XP_053375525.1 uncharacterized protein LOC128547303 [Mercenaria mercenaria]